MSGIITIKENEGSQKKIHVSSKNTYGFGKLLLVLFWLAVLLSGLYFLRDLTEDFTDIRAVLGHLGA